ncbi:hypothetical protein M011DRAFT_66349 [Sporormia fimetaria CBS 119925]|uniref:Uncharacterized protein n=1 Tax=Sporormia fimetaria CBS 119925 TaxID=1340428 RepID=A0A6A6VDJ7_9PLEO|nr:hypothetical protein M011DRAFT_66349 [Sporormia fimetaria CBS 119925]
MKGVGRHIVLQVSKSIVQSKTVRFLFFFLFCAFFVFFCCFGAGSTQLCSQVSSIWGQEALSFAAKCLPYGDRKHSALQLSVFPTRE